MCDESLDLNGSLPKPKIPLFVKNKFQNYLWMEAYKSYQHIAVHFHMNVDWLIWEVRSIPLLLWKKKCIPYFSIRQKRVKSGSCCEIVVNFKSHQTIAKYYWYNKLKE